MTDLLIAHHGYCFDGAASAALFTRFFRETQAKPARVTYRGMHYEPGAPDPGDRLDKSAVNALLDYRYTTSPLLTWYFDHHVSAFQTPGSEGHMRADASGKRFHDGTYGSCTQLIADVAKTHFGWSAPDLHDLLHWADMIDAARFANADDASSFEAPAMVLGAVIQEQGDDNLCSVLIPMLAEKPMAEVAALPMVQAKLAPIRQRHETIVRRMETVGEQRGRVAIFDLSESPVEAIAKFAGYKLFPTAMYAITLSRTPKRIKVSVGFNPWSKAPRLHNIASLCEKYGGGGHPVVGAFALTTGEMPRARQAIEDIIKVLNS